MLIKNDPSDYNEKMRRYRDYIEALEAERRKIQVFERELPFCLELVTQAIEGCKQQMSVTTADFFNCQSECSEQTSSEGPVLEEFIPLKGSFSIDEDEQQSFKAKSATSSQGMDMEGSDKSSQKPEWLRSVHLSIQTPDPSNKMESAPGREPIMEAMRNGGGAFHPFKRDKNCGLVPPSIGPRSPSSINPRAAVSSTANMGSTDGRKSEEKEGQSQRKARRCWSPELHKCFLQALQQLGGTHVATPKQIRELMKVDGLTNDEVKSHLQKYRLYTRRPIPSNHNSSTPQAPQFVVVGGIWVPPPEQASSMAAAASAMSGDSKTPKGIYAPKASLPPSVVSAPPSRTRQAKRPRSDGAGNRSKGAARSDSPATSLSSHATSESNAC